MAGETLRVRYQRGDAVIELEGDAESVLAELASLRADGFGTLMEFFGLLAPKVPGTPSPGVPPAPGAPPPPPMTSPALTLQFLLDRLLLPTHRSDHAIDLDGDGRLDNQFGNVFGALAAQNLDLQRGIDDALMDGSLVVLVTLATEQPVLNANQRADLTIVRGIATGGGHQAFLCAPRGTRLGGESKARYSRRTL